MQHQPISDDCRECGRPFAPAPTGIARRVCWACRVLSRIDASGDCWLWTGAMKREGYGHCVRPWPDKTWTQAHRAVLAALGVMDLDDPRDVDHLCQVRGCVNPDHLEVVTRAVNLHRADGGRVWRTRRARYGPTGLRKDAA